MINTNTNGNNINNNNNPDNYSPKSRDYMSSIDLSIQSNNDKKQDADKCIELKTNTPNKNNNGNTNTNTNINNEIDKPTNWPIFQSWCRKKNSTLISKESKELQGNIEKEALQSFLTIANEKLIEQQTKIYIKVNNGWIANVFSQLISYRSDWSGFILGTNKIDREMNSHHWWIDNIILIYDKAYLVNNLGKLITKLTKKYMNKLVLGLISAKSYSFPYISIKEQKYYFEAKTIVEEVSESRYPFLFGAFSHNKNEKINSFSSSFWIYDEKGNKFQTIPYDSYLLKYPYRYKTHPLANRSILNKVKPKVFEDEYKKLLLYIQSSLQEIDGDQMKKIKELKKAINGELDEYKELIDKIKKDF